MSLQQVVAALRSPDPAQRKDAVVRLARTRDPRAAPYLRQVVDEDPSAELRYLARKGLQFLQQGDAGAPAAPPPRQAMQATADERQPAVLRRNLASEDREVRLKAIRLCSLDRTEGMAPALAMRLRAEQDSGVLATAIEALGNLRDPRVVPHLVPWLKHADTRLRANTVEALGKMETDLALTYLIPHLRDPDNRCRANAVLALRRSGRVNVYKTLETMLASPSASMQDSATFCLGQMGLGTEVFRLLAQAMQSAFTVTRNQARAVLRRLSERGSPRADEVLRRFGAGDEQDAVEDLLERVVAPEEPAEEVFVSPEARAAGILANLQQISGDASLDQAKPGRDRPGEVLERLQGLRGLSEAGPPEPARRADQVLAQLRDLGRVAGEAPAVQRPPGERDAAVVADLRALASLGETWEDRREVRQAQLLNALRSLGGP